MTTTSAVMTSGAPPEIAGITPVAYDEDFQFLVNKELRGELSDTQAAELYQPANLRRWRAALVSMKREVENQIANTNVRIAQARRDFYGDERRWLSAYARETENRVRKIKFLTAIEKSLLTVTELSAAVSADDAARYREAIEAHRVALEEMDIEFSDADIALHQVLG